MGSMLSKNTRETRSNNRGLTPKTSFMDLIKLECLKPKKMKRTRELFPAEKKMRKLTLEDWLIASPGNLGLKPNESLSTGGELCVFKQFSNRVHPSTTSTKVQDHAFSTPRGSFSSDVSSSADGCSGRRSRSGKRVSFRLPEEADIFVFYSPPEAFDQGSCNVSSGN